MWHWLHFNQHLFIKFFSMQFVNISLVKNLCYVYSIIKNIKYTTKFITIKYVLRFYYEIYLTSQGHVKNLIAHH